MKLRNKKTGEIVDLHEGIIRDDCEHITIKPVAVLEKCYIYNSLAELNEEWEDYEEPKEYWYIDDAGVIQIDQVLSSEINMRKSIGNYFETEEEAEKAVEKLKAWKRLKDNGFEFNGIRLEGSNCLIKTKLKDNTGVTFAHAQQFSEDIDLLFGGED